MKKKYIFGLTIFVVLCLAVILRTTFGTANSENVERTTTETKIDEAKQSADLSSGTGTQAQDIREEKPEGQAETLVPGVLSCSNCWLAPVSKDYHLPASYIPFVQATGLYGGGSLIPEAADALGSMFAAATAAGIDIYTTSAYRSYQTQVETFNYWVGIELAKGLNQVQAEAAANTYSARPGESEHQLGTTVDLVCRDGDFASTPCNQQIWQWLADNAADYGFALSYPPDKQEITGYTYEPWHYRYIGPENTAAFNAQTALTLNQWLADQYSP